jgi:hypothetical protein
MDTNCEAMDGENVGPSLITGFREYSRERIPPDVSPGQVGAWVLAIGVAWGLLGTLPCSAMGCQKQSVSHSKTRSSQLQAFFMSIGQVESSGRTDAVGGGGRSLGKYQIQPAYWSDGGGDPHRYRRLVFDHAACRRVMVGYWCRYCPDALADHDWQTLARTHNGGAGGAGKAQTVAYWLKVRHTTLVVFPPGDVLPVVANQTTSGGKIGGSPSNRWQRWSTP